MHKSIDFSKTKLISNPIKEITWDTSDENDKKLDELLPDKDKLFIVVYLDVRKLSSSDAKRMFHFWKDYMDTNLTILSVISSYRVMRTELNSFLSKMQRLWIWSN